MKADIAVDRESNMKCPKCQAEIERIQHRGIRLGRCTRCRGLWLDIADLQKLREMKGSESIDIGDPEEGRKWNQVIRINCPLCQTRLTPMIDRQQPQLWYEACPTCYGVFFDAGEFRNCKEGSLLDRLRNLLAENPV